MLTILTTIFIFLFVWFTMFLWHEVGHCLEAYRQGCRNIGICLKFKKFTMKMYHQEPVRSEKLLYLSGGLYSSILSFAFVLVSGGMWRFSFLTLGIINLQYAIFEAKYLNKIPIREYKLGRYGIYIVSIVFMLMMWFK